MPTEPESCLARATRRRRPGGGPRRHRAALFSFRDGGLRPAPRIELGINGVPMGLARDLLLPPHGWTLQVSFEPVPGSEAAPELVVELREERTGMTIEVQDELSPGPGFATLTIPATLGMSEGLARRAGARATSATEPSPRIGAGFASAPSWGVRRSASARSSTSISKSTGTATVARISSRISSGWAS